MVDVLRQSRMAMRMCHDVTSGHGGLARQSSIGILGDGVMGRGWMRLR